MDSLTIQCFTFHQISFVVAMYKDHFLRVSNAHNLINISAFQVEEHIIVIKCVLQIYLRINQL